MKRRPTAPSLTWVSIAMTPKSKLWKSPGPVCSVASKAKLGYGLVFVQAGLDPSAHVVRADVRIDRARVHREVTPLVLRGVKPNHGETARRAVPVVNLREAPRPPHDL